ncbi:MAG: hypothetical protein IKI65_02405, partial [Firmicutes bacterium]|nr:hypothetical protein [Bacillota bacterium]
MTKTRSTVAVILSVLMVMTLAMGLVIGMTGTGAAAPEKIEFGSYPQALLTNLNKPEELSENGKNVQTYEGSYQKSDGTACKYDYKDVSVGNDKYRILTFKEGNPQGLGLEIGKEYAFKY